jgi:transposase-like protein
MNKSTHRVSLEVKQDILKRVKEQGVPVIQAAKEHGVHESTIYNWLGAGVKGTPTRSEISKLHKQNQELLALVGELTVRLSATQKKSW